MKYKSFRIRNFKGIKDTTIELQGLAGPNVFAFVGLNESGKTTVLEAIHSFSPDEATSELLEGETGVPFKDRVPRHLISEFTGDVTVIATLLVSRDDKKAIGKLLLEKHMISVDVVNFPDEVVLDRSQRFENGDFKQSFLTLRTSITLKTAKDRRWRTCSIEERVLIRDIIYQSAPTIAYFPTFVFDFPASIYLTDRGGTVDQFYRRVFQDILDYDGRGHTIEKDIVRRVRSEKLTIPWLSFLTTWRDHDDRGKDLTRRGPRWRSCDQVSVRSLEQDFQRGHKNKEIVISYDTVEGEIEDTAGNKTKTKNHDVVIKFQIKDGTRRFDVNDRSLGFRWFFSFMLFTQFRVARSGLGSRPLLFLFDEPASNLHAAAQQKLIESSGDCTKGAYSGVFDA